MDNGKQASHRCDLEEIEDLNIDTLERYTSIEKLCGKYYKMSQETENILVSKAQKGCLRSRDRLITNNLSFIIYTINKMYPAMDYHELLSSGCLGMVKAIDRYDSSKRFRLISYAVHWIKSLTQKQMQHDKLIHEPYYYPKHRVRIADRTLETGESWDVAAETLGIKKMVRGYLEVTHTPVSLHKTLYPHNVNGTTLEDILADEKENPPDYITERNILREDIVAVVNTTIKGRNLDIVRKVFGFYDESPMTYQEVGEIYDLSRERIRQIIDKSLIKIAKQLTRRGINASALDIFG